MKVSNFSSILKYNIKIIFNINTIAAIVFLLLTPVFFNLRMVTYPEIAQIGEMYLSVIGVVLLTYLCSIEEGCNVKELVYARSTPFVLQLLIRLGLAFFMIFFLQLLIFISCVFQGGEFDLAEISSGTWITSLFLGMLGLTFSNIINDVKSGYLIAFSYYIFEFGTKGKYTNGIYLFSLLNGSFREKYYLLALIILFILINCLIIWKRS
jgi:hypothetical protein